MKEFCSGEPIYGMRLLFVSGARTVGGAEVYLTSLVGWLRRSGVDCVLVCSPCLRGHPRFLGLLNQRDQEAGDACFGPHGRLSYLGFLRYLGSVDVPFLTHLNLPSPVSRGLIFLPLLCRVGGASVVVATEHLPRIACRPIARWLKGVIGHWVDLTIVVCETGRLHLIGHFGMADSKVRVVHNGVSIPSDWDPLESRRALGIGESTVMILQVASLERRKGQATLLSALQLLMARNLDSNVVLFFVGGGPDARWLQREADRLNVREAVRFVGHQEIVAEYYSAADIFVLPSEKESFPLSILEAMSFGLPVVASEIDGIPEQVVHGRSGFLFQVGDVSTLAESIEILVRRCDLRIQFGEMGRQIVKNRFSLEESCQRTLRLWREVVSHEN